MNSARTFKVTEAQAKDVGRGLVRLDPRDLMTLGVHAGETVRLTGKRAAFAKALQSFAEDYGLGMIQMDGLLRENAQAAIGERVQLEPAVCPTARSVLLQPIDETRPAGPNVQHLAAALDGLPVVTGDRVRPTLIGGAHREFVVKETNPRGPVIIASSTSVKVKGEGLARPGGEAERITYEDIGGLRKQLQRIREMVELPLRYPELFDRVGIDPPKGLLLYGPPGAGKTLVAKALANETSAYFVHIGGPEIMGKYYGESEERLRRVFEEAQEHAPAIVFIDEIDALAPKREDMASQQQVERRVVAQLLSLMDGLKARGQVAVIGATNAPHLIDPALRRPGRFDREINIGVPERAGRLEILEVHTRAMPIADDVSLERLADVTHGFVGADLAALCREAAMAAVRAVTADIPLDAESVPMEVLRSVLVTMAHFLAALNEVAPSALREVFTEIPYVSWDDVGGLEDAKAALRQVVDWPLQHARLFAEAKTTPPKGVLLAGPSGTGKTLLARAIASRSGANFISVKGPEVLSRWLGDSERMVRDVFKLARLSSPCVVFFDEIEALTAGGDIASVGERVTSQILTEMDGIEELRGVVVIAATNRPDRLDPALLRSGRFELRLDLPPPDGKARREILSIHTREKPLATGTDAVDLDRIASRTNGFSGSDLESLCRRAAMNAIADRVDAGDGLPLSINAANFEAALAFLLKSRPGARSTPSAEDTTNG